MSDHRIADIMLSYNPCNPSTPSPPDLNDLSFRYFGFNRTDFDSVNANLESIKWKQWCELCLPEEFSELMTLVLLQICEICCPRKQSTSQGCSSSTKIASRKKRKIQCKLKEAKLNPPHFFSCKVSTFKLLNESCFLLTQISMMLSMRTYNIEKCRQFTKSTLIPSISLAMRRNSRNKNITYQSCLKKTKTLLHVQSKLQISSNGNSIACSVIHQRQRLNLLPLNLLLYHALM